MAQAALNWAVTQPGSSAAIAGASSADQLGASVAALDFELPAELRAALDAATAAAPASACRRFTPACRGWLVSPGREGGRQPGRVLPRRAQPGR